MKKYFNRMLGLILCLALITGNLLPVVFAASTNVYELTFDNIFIFEQWANHPNLTVLGEGASGSTITTDVEAGSFVLVNSSTTSEVFTSYSPTNAGASYNMVVDGNTEYIFSYVANGTTVSFQTFVFFFDTSGEYIDLAFANATQYGQNQWTFTTPAGAGYIQIRFDNDTPNSNVTVSDIIIRPSAVHEYAVNYDYRKTFTYTEGATYGALPVPSRDNLVFAGWYTGPNGTGDKITSSTTVAASSKCLYSKWDPIIAGDIEIVSLPIKQDYCVGDKLNTRGLVLGISYPDGTSENIDEGFSVSPSVLTAAGTQAITITYGGTSAQFTVNVVDSEERVISINGTEKTVAYGNYTYTLNYSGTAFNRYEIAYSSDAYVKAEMTTGSVTEEFFLEPNDNGTFSGYIDGFLSGTTQTTITTIKFTPLDKDIMTFAMTDITLSQGTNPGDSEGMVYLDGTNYKIGIDLDWGGALTYMEDKTNTVYSSVSKYGTSKITEVDFKSKVNTSSFMYNTSSSVNLINAHDTGRLVQQSYYGTGSYPYEPGMYGEAVWNYNPVQGGNLYNEASKIVDIQISENEIYIKCRPLDWAKEAVDITPSYMEAWYTLEDGMMRATCRFVDFSGYPSVTTTQELPAFYCVEPLNDFVYFTGGDAWSDSNTQQTITDLGFWGTATDQDYICNENWGAFKGDDTDSFAIGIYCPGQTLFHTGVYYGGDGATRCSTTTPATEDPTSYIGVVDTLHFQSFNPISYCYYIKTGTVDTIRSSFKTVAETETDICNATSTNGFCDMCRKYIEPEISTDEYDVNGDGAMDSVYEIGTAGELLWFSDYVNAGNTSANAVVTNNITVNKNLLSDDGNIIGAIEHTWTPIGTGSAPYNGIFHGQGHTISGLFYSAESDYGGLFGGIGSNGSVREIGLTDSYISAANYSGGIAGKNSGEIINCFVSRSFVYASTKSGGIVGENSGNVSTCYSTAFSYGVSYAGAVCGNNTSAISDCYYLENNSATTELVFQNGIGGASSSGFMSDTDDITTAKTLEEFYSGEVAYLLQKANSSQIWGQISNTKNSAPVFDYTGEYKVLNISGNDCYSVCFVGDLITDDNVDIADYQQLVNHAVAQDDLSDDNIALLRSDLNADGYIDALDCSLMALMIKGFKEGISIYPVGDFDHDGTAFTDEDIASVKKGLINQETLSTWEKYACDLNSDGVLDVNDRDILEYRKETSYAPICLDLSKQIEMRKTTANVIIISGQSNAYGASPYTSEVASVVEGVDYSNVNIKYNNINTDGITGWKTYFSNSSFETFRPGIGGQGAQWFGPELGLAYYLATNEATKDETWYIIKYTAAGTFLGGNWIYDSNYNMAANSENIYNDLGGYLSDLMISYVDSALDEIAGIHGENNINIRSFMWHQGESDSGFEQWANQYGDLQNILVNNVRDAFISRDADAHIGFVDGGIAAYNSNTFYNPLTSADQTYNSWVYSDTVNTHKTNNASMWYVPVAGTTNVINISTAGIHQNTSASTTTLDNSIWIDTSSCKSKYENNNENGEYDGAHYCSESMFNIGQWYAYGMLQVSNF